MIEKVSENERLSRRDAADDFNPGLYRHYKGGLYTAICIVTHHETREPMVLYVSHDYGGTNVRPLLGWCGDDDGWLDELMVDGKLCSRFEYLGTLPSNTKVRERSAPRGEQR